MSTLRYLIVNADDFGQTSGINRGIIDSYERGIVTSTSLMVRWPAAAEAGAYAKAHEELSLGLHVDLGEWRKVDWDWKPIYEVVAIDDEAAVREEVERQMETFERLSGRRPSHLDCHQHVHMREPVVRAILLEIATDLEIPLRQVTAGVQYCGDFYGQDVNGRSLPSTVSPEGLTEILKALPAGLTELACHPGFVEDLDTMYRTERAWEVDTLTDARVKKALERFNISLRSFSNLPVI